MTIDIIDLSDPEYSDLSPIQMAMVRAAQLEKDDVVASAKAEKDALFLRLLDRNAVRATARTFREAEIDAATAARIDAIREDLILRINYEKIYSEGNEYGPYRYPENPNPNLSPSQRFLVVRQYYMDITGDPEARLQAFAMDTLARSYLGEYYQTLYDLLVSYCK